MHPRALALPAVVLVACGEPSVEPRAPAGGVAEAPSSTAAVPATETSTRPLPLLAPSAPLVDHKTIGDTTCEVDADCAVTTKAECCDCCPSHPMATSVKWLSWRDENQCGRVRCEPCGAVDCALSLAPPIDPICRKGTCSLVGRP